VISSSRSIAFEAHFQEPPILQKVKIAMDTLAQNLKLKNLNQSFSKLDF